MRVSSRRKLGGGFILLLLLLIVVVVSGGAAAFPAVAHAANITYNLYATDGYIPLADGASVYNYGFVGGRQGQSLTYMPSVTPTGAVDYDPATGAGSGVHPGFTYNPPVTVATGAPAPTGGPVTAAEQQFAGNCQFPAPLIYCAIGDVVTIRLKNLGTTVPTAPDDPHSIHLHGLDVGAANDGVPETSVGAVSANAKDANGNPLPGAGNVVVYMFKANRTGSSMYHCHQEADIHVQMGMYGALVVYNSSDAARVGGPGSNKGGTQWGWCYNKETVMLLSEMDTRQHGSEEVSGPYNPVDYKPQYWFINGLSFPNTIHVGLPGATGWQDWIASHPGYDPYIVGSVSRTQTSSAVPKGDKVLLRVVNMGYEVQPMHMHGFHAKIIGSDQRPWPWANLGQSTAWGKGMEKNTLTIGSGETYEWLINMGLQSTSSTYPVDTQTRYDPATGLPTSNTATGNPVISDMGGVPYIGGPVVTGAQGLPTIGQLFPFHNHDDYKATNNGVYPGGQFTMIETLP